MTRHFARDKFILLWVAIATLILAQVWQTSFVDGSLNKLHPREKKTCADIGDEQNCTGRPNCVFTCGLCQENNENLTQCIPPPCHNYHSSEEDCTLIDGCVYSCGMCQLNNGFAKLCHPCDTWNIDPAACNRKDFCWYSYRQKKCVHDDAFVEAENCDRFRYDGCLCLLEQNCHFRYTDFEYIEPFGASRVFSKGCYNNEPFANCNKLFQETLDPDDCIRGHGTGNDHYFLHGIFCTSKFKGDIGNCDIDEVIADTGERPYHPVTAGKYARHFLPIAKEGRYELTLRIPQVVWKESPVQIFPVRINGALISLKFNSDEFGNKGKDIVAIIRFKVASGPSPASGMGEKNIALISGFGDTYLNPDVEDSSRSMLLLEFGNPGYFFPDCDFPGSKWNVIQTFRFVRFKDTKSEE